MYTAENRLKILFKVWRRCQVTPSGRAPSALSHPNLSHSAQTIFFHVSNSRNFLIPPLLNIQTPSNFYFQSRKIKRPSKKKKKGNQFFQALQRYSFRFSRDKKGENVRIFIILVGPVSTINRLLYEKFPSEIVFSAIATIYTNLYLSKNRFSPPRYLKSFHQIGSGRNNLLKMFLQ